MSLVQPLLVGLVEPQAALAHERHVPGQGEGSLLLALSEGEGEGQVNRARARARG